MRYNYAVKMAEKAHKQKGERFYVMPDHNDKLIVMSRRDMRILRRYRFMARSVNMYAIMKECFYATADRKGQKLSESILKAKRDMYIQYITRGL